MEQAVSLLRNTKIAVLSVEIIQGMILCNFLETHMPNKMAQMFSTTEKKFKGLENNSGKCFLNVP